MFFFKKLIKEAKALIFALIFLSISTAYSINTLNTGYQVANSATVAVNAHSVCKKVTNNTGHSMFIPTKTSEEWQAFVSNPMNGVALSYSATTGTTCYNSDIYYTDTCGSVKSLKTDCNDGKVCTTDSCSSGTCIHSNVAPGTSCGSNMACDGSGNCVTTSGTWVSQGQYSGTCKSGNLPSPYQLAPPWPSGTCSPIGSKKYGVLSVYIGVAEIFLCYEYKCQ